MITINLTPIEELENPYWWIPDAAAFAGVVTICLGAILLYVHLVQGEIDASLAEKARLIEETNALNPEVEKFNGLNTKIAALDSKKNALTRITESKLVRYLPIILLENIQNLKPEGVWLNSLTFVDKKPEGGDPGGAPVQVPPPNGAAVPPDGAPAATGNKDANLFSDHRSKDYPITIEIIGSALNNIAIAEFMMALKATQNQSFEKSDLRTQLFFSDVGISFSQIVTAEAAGKDEKIKVRPNTVSFKLLLSFRERDGTSGENNSNFSQFIEKFKRDGQATMY